MPHIGMLCVFLASNAPCLILYQYQFKKVAARHSCVAIGYLVHGIAIVSVRHQGHRRTSLNEIYTCNVEAFGNHVRGRLSALFNIQLMMYKQIIIPKRYKIGNVLMTIYNVLIKMNHKKLYSTGSPIHTRRLLMLSCFPMQGPTQ